MKLLRNITLFALLLTLTGCFSEDYSICPPIEEANVTLHFSLLGKEKREGFTDNISAVDVLIYDERGAFQDSINVSQQELREFQGTHLTLPAGEYRLVCWGNSGEHVEMKGVRTEQTPTITHSKVDENRVGNANRVFYAGNIKEITTRASDIPDALRLVVPEEGNREAEAHFRHAHRRLTVCVQGFTHDLQPAHPEVALHGLPLGLNLLTMEQLPDATEVSNHQMTKEQVILGEKYSCSTFDVFWFDTDNSIEINIYDPISGELVFTVPLNDAIKGTLDDDLIEISLVIRFKGGEVEIEIPNWGSSDVGWE